MESCTPRPGDPTAPPPASPCQLSAASVSGGQRWPSEGTAGVARRSSRCGSRGPTGPRGPRSASFLKPPHPHPHVHPRAKLWRRHHPEGDVQKRAGLWLASVFSVWFFFSFAPAPPFSLPFLSNPSLFMIAWIRKEKIKEPAERKVLYKNEGLNSRKRRNWVECRAV